MKSGKRTNNLITLSCGSFLECALLFERGIHYARSSYPELKLAEKDFAKYAGTEDAALFNSGMAGIVTLMKTFTSIDFFSDVFNVGASEILYSETRKYFKKNFIMPFFNPKKIDEYDFSDFGIIFAEIIGNGYEMPIIDFSKVLTGISCKETIYLIIDNTFLTSILFDPIHIAKQFGREDSVVVVESMTKYYQEGKDIITGGVIYGPAEIIKMVKEQRAMMGTYLQPLCLQQLKVEQIPEIHKKVMPHHSKNALELAKWLERQPQVVEVKYPLLKSHPQYELAKQLFPNGCGGLFFFKLKGGKAAAQKFIDSLQYCTIGGSFGHNTTWVCPYDAVKEDNTGIIRVAAGFQKGDLPRAMNDFEQALAKI